MFYLILKHIHSELRWMVLILIIFSILVAAIKIIKKKYYSRIDKSRNMITTMVAHLQYIIGLALYFISNKVIFSIESFKNSFLRFFLVEHLIGMTVAVVLITIGYSLSKKAQSDKSKHIRIVLFDLLALIVIFISIPWPWNNFGAGWF